MAGGTSGGTPTGDCVGVDHNPGGGAIDAAVGEVLGGGGGIGGGGGGAATCVNRWGGGGPLGGWGTHGGSALALGSVVRSTTSRGVGLVGIGVVGCGWARLDGAPWLLAVLAFDHDGLGADWLNAGWAFRLCCSA